MSERKVPEKEIEIIVLESKKTKHKQIELPNDKLMKTTMMKEKIRKEVRVVMVQLPDNRKASLAFGQVDAPDDMIVSVFPNFGHKERHRRGDLIVLGSSFKIDIYRNLKTR